MNTETNTATSTSTSKGPGRPKFVLKYPRGSFTFKELYELNRGEKGRGKKAKVCELTVRNHIKDQLEVGFLTKLDETVETGKPGQPAHRYIRTAVKASAEARAAARAAEKAASTTPTEGVVPTADISLTETPAVEVVPMEAVTA